MDKLLEEQLGASKVAITEETTAAIGCLSISGEDIEKPVEDLEAIARLTAAREWIAENFPDDPELAAIRKANDQKYRDGKFDNSKGNYTTEAARFYAKADNASATIASVFDRPRIA